MEIKTIAIVGAGALGVLWGDYTQRALGSHAVRFIVDPERAARYRRDGIYCNGARCDFIYTDGRGAAPVDLVIFAVKATGLQDALEEAEPYVGPETTLISLLNGVTSEERIGAHLGPEKVLYAVAQGMDATRFANKVVYKMPGELRIGIPKDQPEKQERLHALIAFLEKIGYPYTVEEDILHRMWGKLMLNVGVNQTCMVFETDYGGVQRPGKARDTMLAAMDEARKIAFCNGIVITREEVDAYVALLDSLTPEGMPSMRQDGLAGRSTEVELFAGAILHDAGQYGIRTPVNRWLYERIREMEGLY